MAVARKWRGEREWSKFAGVGSSQPEQVAAGGYNHDMQADQNQPGPAGVGRYAPSPSGPLHFGSLVAALASFLQARTAGAAWYMRIEDIDPPREVPGAADDILRALEAHGLHWDGPVLYQSRRLAAYQDSLAQLERTGLAFACGCTRKQAQTGPQGIEGPIYPGTCRNGLPPGRSPRSLRLRVDAGHQEFSDRVQGRVVQNLRRDVGDFVLRRADGCFAYQLAVVVDDAYQGITEVVRGADLLTSTPRQRFLQQCLGLPQPEYCHVPVVLDDLGEKLSKHSHAAPLDPRNPGQALWRALRFLGQAPPAVLEGAPPVEVLDWAVKHWDLANISPVCGARF